MTTKQERNFIREGNKLYHEKRFADAEVAYRKALEALPSSEIAQFNLAASLLRQSGSSDPNNGNSPVATATQLLQNLAANGRDVMLSSKSFYNLGNLAFNAQDYGKSIEMYKNALRKNPDDDKARENLRLAQLKQKEQQNQDQNQDKNKDQNQDQNQDQNKDQNQDQNKDQNQDQNKDQNKDQNQDQNQNQNQDQNQNKDQKKDQQQGGISDANAEKILKAMENEEAATRKRVEAEKKKAQAARRKNITNPW
ncbi:MAG: tetratricopeptide repeat protein [Paramuribaculum sp.]|nr:tetratricopeptide repeat protein [Paramuribaculum sp.]